MPSQKNLFSKLIDLVAPIKMKQNFIINKWNTWPPLSSNNDTTSTQKETTINSTQPVKEDD